MREARHRQIDDSMNVSKLTVKTADYSMTIRDARVECDSTDGAFTVTLPPVGEAAGKMFSVYLKVDGGDITIEDSANDSLGWDGDYTLDDVGDGYCFYSDGRSWFPVGSLS
ncbi:hypothetical protein DRO38_08030 [Candidatus Bathyarchaeota archaeon]|nr:MAG: hypothetical protein DRO38_08030 [Candidatus Bathyarchaeota archaeon]